MEPSWLVEAASRRQKWIDQAQSLNIYMAGASGKLDDTYKHAWLRGLKTTYYLRTMAATHVEKSTVTRGSLNAVSSGSDGGSALDAAAAPGICRRPRARYARCVRATPASRNARLASKAVGQGTGPPQPDGCGGAPTSTGRCRGFRHRPVPWCAGFRVAGGPAVGRPVA